MILFLLLIVISIHAPSRERQSALIKQFGKLVFQSTLPRGSDSFGWFAGDMLNNFNPRSLAGATQGVLSCVLLLVFQSTLPRGSDPYYPYYPKALFYFNPRSLAGATGKVEAITGYEWISIHAPSRERQHQNKLLLY